MNGSKYGYLIQGVFLLSTLLDVSTMQCYQCKSEQLVDGTWTNMDCFLDPKGPTDCPPESKLCVIYTAGKTKNEPYEFGRSCIAGFVHPICYLQTWLPEFQLEERCFPQVCKIDGCNNKHPPGYYEK
ncbi:uncharacterized protein LOC135486262 [Lineus longissimus]|uniref:uncharacterized protein LOC135486262 n=1 Tax=Lineus longissimus TaxID=88925 RepID=UPI002B4E216F